MEHLIPIGLAVLAGAAVASATGFGFALVLAPVAVGALGGEPAIWLLTWLAVLVNGLTLATEGRRPELLPDTWPLLAWTLPGSLLGVLVLEGVSDVALQALVTVAVLGSLVVRRAAPGRLRPPAWLAGFSTGVLNTSVGTGGPPLVLYLLHRDPPPMRIRDTLGALFLAGAVLGLVVLAAAHVRPLPETGLVLACAPLAVLGHLAGRRVFARLARHGFEAALVVVLLASVAGGMLRALG